MSQVFIRIYVKDYYFEYYIKEDKKTYLNIINNKLFIMISNKKLTSNFIFENNFKLNKLYYIEEYLFFYVIGCIGNKICIKKEKFKLNEIIFTTSDVEINLEKKYIKFTSPIYVENKFYEQGEFYFNGSLSICTGGL